MQTNSNKNLFKDLARQVHSIRMEANRTGNAEEAKLGFGNEVWLNAYREIMEDLKPKIDATGISVPFSENNRSYVDDVIMYGEAVERVYMDIFYRCLGHEYIPEENGQPIPRKVAIKGTPVELDDYAFSGGIRKCTDKWCD